MSRNLHSTDTLARSLDFGCILLAFATASGIASLLSRVGLFRWPREPAELGWPTEYVVLLIASLILWAMLAAYGEIHKVDRIESSRYSYWRLVRTLLLWLGAMGAAIFFLKLHSLSRQFNLSFFALASALILLRQLTARSLARRRAHHERNLRRAIVIGSKLQAEWLIEVLSRRPEWYGTIEHTDLAEVKAILNGTASESIEPAEIFILPSADHELAVQEWALRLLRQGRTVHVVPALIDAHLFRRNLGDIAGVPTLTLETGNPGDMEIAAKRAGDVIGSLVAILLLLPIVLIIALAIKASSPGPILFRQTRLGRRGKPFKIVKFRTMRSDAEAILRGDRQLYRRYVDNNFKLPEGEDVRVTRLGRVLRASSLDELPQLINVIRGEMSLVGPRPIVPDEIKNYGEYSDLLLMVKPGMTGNWQVSGRSRIVEYSDRVNLDMEYVRDQSLGEDLRILLRTVSAVAKMDGAH
jgi:exopolysaccharide production protein ExoY